MQHPLEQMYGLSAYELLDALSRRFRAKVTLEGAVSEVQMGRKIKALEEQGAILSYDVHDKDGHPDFSIEVEGLERPLLVECKNVRNSDEAYRQGGRVVAYKVETQKTRAAKGDPSSRFYGVDQFDILGVCLGKKTGRWTDFMFIQTIHLAKHRDHSTKLAVMQRVPLPDSEDYGHWFTDLGQLLKTIH